MKAYQQTIFGFVDGQAVKAYTFENNEGYRLRVMTYGATILEYVTPDKYGHFTNIIIGFEYLEDYIGNSPKHGASIGPVAGRIANAAFELNHQEYTLEKNPQGTCNHSGSTGWDSAIFEVTSINDDGLTLYTERVDGIGGFPGNLKIWITYQLTEKGELQISYKVETDQDTLVNPTNHSYFNLTGDYNQAIDQHVFQLNTLGIYPIAPDGVPSQEYDTDVSIVKQLNQGILLSDVFASSEPQIQLVSGLDHPFALRDSQDVAGFLYDQDSGRFMTFKTQAPAAVVYTANVCDETVLLKGKPMIQHNGIALELQAVPDAIHGDNRHQVILKAGEVFTSTSTYHAIAKNT